MLSRLESIIRLMSAVIAETEGTCSIHCCIAVFETEKKASY